MKADRKRNVFNWPLIYLLTRTASSWKPEFPIIRHFFWCSFSTPSTKDTTLPLLFLLIFSFLTWIDVERARTHLTVFFYYMDAFQMWWRNLSRVWWKHILDYSTWMVSLRLLRLSTQFDSEMIFGNTKANFDLSFYGNTGEGCFTSRCFKCNIRQSRHYIRCTILNNMIILWSVCQL